ncbi:CLUMA_CG017058, isoform A [Clunio marinus]|uniref:CLUMA_CG017058, isoform A n=1 Tax=Clunio marinus TaxID=568069 RepID=A0A1J1IZC4_9DIPT|nr:CLUMA_CG017058, isoform A [Clunio marinus]
MYFNKCFAIFFPLNEIFITLHLINVHCSGRNGGGRDISPTHVKCSKVLSNLHELRTRLRSRKEKSRPKAIRIFIELCVPTLTSITTHVIDVIRK